MESLNKDVFLKFNPNTLQDIRKTYNLHQTGAMADAVDIFEEWLKKQEHFVKKNFDRGYLERTIIRAKGSVEKAKQRLDKLCTARTLTPIWFKNINVKELTHVDIIHDAVLPKPTSDNYRVYILRNRGQEFEKQFFLSYFTRLIWSLEYQYAHDYVNGVAVIMDFREMNLVNMTRSLDLVQLQNILHMGTECYGFRIKAIHMISSSKFVEAVVAIFKQLLSSKIGDRIYVHKTLDTLHEHVEKDILPAEYGGGDKLLEELHKDFVEVLSSEDHRNYMKIMNAACTNEEYRRTDKFNENCLGMPGTFRALRVD